ncbi:MAG: tryptophan--tRNA ligase [Rickettsiales bacterium]|jgi:tryptophanyl-tRNA synthetase|nr:tryptophan--tRNA ligase [Rickettsiales bacterium]
MADTILTGVKPTGDPHVGNYFGAIRPAVDLVNSNEGAGYIFIADVHALNSVRDPDFMRTKTREVAATFLACGIDPDKTVFYRQSDVPEVFELASILMNFAPKGLMNRAHAYKAVLDRDGSDDNVNMGLYTYPILMAADILAMDADIVPVGLDQKQHIEIARDIAGSLNSAYGREILKMPSAHIPEAVEVIPGLDGRKMSKSYGNVVGLFAAEAETAKRIMKIPTDSLPPEAPKDDESLIYRLMQLFGVEENYRKEFLSGGIGYGEAKKMLAEAANAVLRPVRARYAELIAAPEKIDAVLAAGAVRARASATKTLARVKSAAGLA